MHYIAKIVIESIKNHHHPIDDINIKELTTLHADSYGYGLAHEGHTDTIDNLYAEVCAELTRCGMNLTHSA